MALSSVFLRFVCRACLSLDIELTYFVLYFVTWKRRTQSIPRLSFNMFYSMRFAVTDRRELKFYIGLKFVRRTAVPMKWSHERSEVILTEPRTELVTDCTE